LGILVLVGEIDESFSVSQEALRYFRSIGAELHYEEFRHQGHTLLDTPRIRNWLKVHLGAPNPAAFATRITNAARIADPWQRFLVCSEFYGDAMPNQVTDSVRVAAERINRMWIYQQSVNPAYENPKYDKPVQAYNALGRRAAANGYHLPEPDAKCLMELEARIGEMKRNPQATPGPPLMSPQAASAHHQAIAPRLRKKGALPFGGLGR
jgi:hypothetical protein